MTFINLKKVYFNYLNEDLHKDEDKIENKDKNKTENEIEPQKFSNILNNLNINIGAGEFICVVGKNGSGKSTFAKLLNALLLPSKGQVFINNIDSKNAEKIWEIRKNVGMIFQNPDNQIVSTIVEDDVAFGLENLGITPEKIEQDIISALKKVDMLKYKNNMTYYLSGGQKQKIAVAGILAMNPKCIVLDEATGMLDPQSRKDLLNTISTLNKEYKITIILITHHMDETINADRMIVFNEGEVVLDDKPKNIFLKNETLKKLSLELPYVTQIATFLNENGYNVEKNCLNEKDLIKQILKIGFKKNIKNNFEINNIKNLNNSNIFYNETNNEINNFTGNLINNSVNNNLNNLNNPNNNSNENNNTYNEQILNDTFVDNINIAKNIKHTKNNNINNNKNEGNFDKCSITDFSNINKSFIENNYNIAEVGEEDYNKNEVIIKVKNLTYFYQKDTNIEKKALDNINLEVKKGEFLGIIGQTGSGKSTLVQHLNGLIKSKKNTIFFKNQDIWSNEADLKKIRLKVGLVFQYPENQIFEETVYKEIAFAPKNMGLAEKELKNKVKQSLKLVGLDESFFNKNPLELSGGQKRRVAIASILAMQPEVLIFDEPTAGLDPLTKDFILKNIKEINQKLNTTIILISHSMEDITKFANRIAIMQNGKLSNFNSVEDIFCNVEKVKQFGLKLPKITEIFYNLNKTRSDIPFNIFTLEQAKQFLLHNLNRKEDN